MIGGAARFLEPLPYPDYLGLDAAARAVSPARRRAYRGESSSATF